MNSLYLLLCRIATAVTIAGGLAISSGCEWSKGNENCTGECDSGWPRFAMGILAPENGDAGESDAGEGIVVDVILKTHDFERTLEVDLSIPFTDDQGDCGFDVSGAGMLWTVCTTNGPKDEWVDVTVSQDEARTTTERVDLAEHNYCGHDIAYVVVRLHEDGPPTFNEVTYVSPCEGSGAL